MSMLGALVLTTAIGVSASRSPASEQKDAYKALSKAVYIETKADKVIKQLEKKFIPKELREYGWIPATMKVVTEKKVSLEWTF